MNFELITKRLQLRPCQLTDLINLHRLWINDQIRYFLFDNRIISLDEARSFIETSTASFAQYRYGIWLVFDSTISDFIGFAGLLHTDGTPHLIYGIHPNYWGNGYATEAAQAVLHYGIESLSLSEIRADVDEPNLASVQVLRKLGMLQVGYAVVNDRPLLYFARS